MGPQEKLMEIPHILVADDDADTRELVELVLRRAGFRVSVTDNSSQVLNVLGGDRFDALLLDNYMTKINGIELCQLIRSMNRSIPIVICSGAVADCDKKAALAAGAQGYISKPFAPHELSETLNAVLAQAKVQE